MEEIALFGANENWIVDRFKEEYLRYIGTKKHFRHVEIKNARWSDYPKNVWFIGDWIMDQHFGNFYKLKDKNVIVSCHHFVPWNFDNNQYQKYKLINGVATKFHVPCESTKEFMTHNIGIGPEKIHVNPFWMNKDLFHKVPVSKEKLRENEGISKDDFIVFSAVRDTLGATANSPTPQPKREKGPQHFVEILREMKKEIPNLAVYLAGWRRQYVKAKLDEYNIKYYEDSKRNNPENYAETSNARINMLYNMSDLVINPALVEGGPMSLPESVLTKTPVISTDTGIVRYLLDDKSIYTNPDDYKAWKDCLQNAQQQKTIDSNYEKAKKYMISFLDKNYDGFEFFDNLIGAKQ